jgi:nuclear transport factor 2 (NTF2) superfamily protein
VRFAYEWHDDSGHWFRSYGNENWEFDELGLMRRRTPASTTWSSARPSASSAGRWAGGRTITPDSATSGCRSAARVEMAAGHSTNQHG